MGKISEDATGKGKSPTTVTTNNYTTVNQNGANINITNINNHHTYVIFESFRNIFVNECHLSMKTKTIFKKNY